MAYAGDLKSPVPYGTCGFDPHPGYQIFPSFASANVMLIGAWVRRGFLPCKAPLKIFCAGRKVRCASYFSMTKS